VHKAAHIVIMLFVRLEQEIDLKHCMRFQVIDRYHNSSGHAIPETTHPVTMPVQLEQQSEQAVHACTLCLREGPTHQQKCIGTLQLS
jgi:hypothetical protein